MHEFILKFLRTTGRLLQDDRLEHASLATIEPLIETGTACRQFLAENTLRVELAQRLGLAGAESRRAHVFCRKLMLELINVLVDMDMVCRLLRAHDALHAALQQAQPQTVHDSRRQAALLMVHYTDIYATKSLSPAGITCQKRLQTLLDMPLPVALPVGPRTTPPVLGVDVTPFLVASLESTVAVWLAESLNAHPFMLAIPGYERKQRLPATPEETHNWQACLPYFLQNIGRPSKASGDCGSCTPEQMASILRIHGNTVRAVLLLCHPYSWLENHMGANKTVTAAFNAVQALCNASNFHGLPCARAEELLDDPTCFDQLARHLSADKCAFSPALLRTVYARAPHHPPDPSTIWASWPQWLRNFFTLFVPEKTLETYQKQGYDMSALHARLSHTQHRTNAGKSLPLQPEDICLELASVAPPLAACYAIHEKSLPTGYQPLVTNRFISDVLAAIDDNAALCIVADTHMVMRLLEEAHAHTGSLTYVDMDLDEALPLRLAFSCPKAQPLALEDLAGHKPDILLVSGPITLQKIRDVVGELSYPCINFAELVQQRYQEAKEQIFDQVVEAINTLNPDVLYVGNYMYFNMVRQSMAMRKKGLKTAILVLESTNLKHKKSFFDGIFTAWQDPTLLFSILRAVDGPRIVHVQGWMTQHFLPLLVKIASPRSRVICEFNDIASCFIPWDDYEHIWGPQSRKLEQYSEKAVHHLPDGLIYNHASACAEAKHAEYASPLPFTIFHSYPTPDLYAPLTERPRTEGNRLAFIGTIVPSSHPHDYWGDVNMLSLFEKLVKARFTVDAYALPYQQAENPSFADYQYLQKRQPEFCLHNGLPPHKLAAVLTEYDYGLMIYDFTGVRVLPDHLAGIMPSKFYSYLEACLPIIVSEELAYVADEVRTHHLGLVVTQREVHEPALLARRLEAVDCEAMRGHIRAYRNAHNMDKEAERLLDFYNALRHTTHEMPDKLSPVRRRIAQALETQCPLVVAPYLLEPQLRKFLAHMGIAQPDQANIQCFFDNMTEYHHLKVFEKYAVRARNAENIAALPKGSRFLVVPCYGYPAIVESLRRDFYIPDEQILYVPYEA